MDYSIYCYTKNYPTTLNADEIAAPLHTLKELLRYQLESELLDDFRLLFQAVFSQHYWKKIGGPGVIYEIYGKLTKILDTLWVIHKTRLHEAEPTIQYEDWALAKQFQRLTFDKKFLNKLPKVPMVQTEVPPLILLATIFQEMGISHWRMTVSIWTQAALSLGFINNFDYDFCDIPNSNLVKEYREMEEIIHIAYELIKQAEIETFALITKIEVLKIYALEHDHPTCMEEKEIKKPEHIIENPYYYFYFDHLEAALWKWYTLMFDESHWDKHNDPGTIFYLRRFLEEQIEAAWLLMQNGHPNEVIHSFFEHKPLHEWKELLEYWTFSSFAFNKDEIDSTKANPLIFEKVLKLMQALHDLKINSKNYIINISAMKPLNSNVETDDKLKEIINRLVSLFLVEHIYLVKSQTENIERIELIILVANKCNKTLGELIPLADMVFADKNQFCYRMFHAHQVKDAMRQGNLFFYSTCTSENLLYSLSESDYELLPEGISPDTALQTAKDCFHAEIAKIDAFKAGAIFFYEQGKLSHATFMLHQSIELYYRTIELFVVGRAKTVHPIRKHQQYIQPFVPRLGNLFKEDDAMDDQLLQLVDDAYFAARYEDDFIISHEQVAAIREKAERAGHIINEVYQDTIKVFEAK